MSVFRSSGPDLVELSRSKASCCGGRADTAVFSPLSIPEYETYRLTATYYSLRDDLTTTLMLNNKGSEPILAWPTFYSLSGTRLQLAPITVEAASYLDVDMHQLLAYAGDEFREGSMKIAYEGGSMQLGAQVRMVDAERNLIWAEQFVYGSKFISSRLETVWWLPYDESITRVVVSNTSGGTVSATIAVEGTAPHQPVPANIMLAPWETRVLAIMSDLVGHGHGLVKSKGGISIVHTGSPGAVLARMFISEPNRGYSAAASFIDPETTASQRWHGSGLRLKNLNGTKLEPVLAVRNTGEQLSRVQGRIIYTQPDGSTSTINLPQQPIAPGATRVINLDNLIENANVPNAVTYGGIELEYDTPKGTIITSVQSLSQNGDHVFQVPMFDPQNMPSSAGGFPWKADGDYTTVVYIKNETNVARKFVSHLVYDGGQYSPGIRDLKPGETIGIDFRELRDNQSPGSQENIIPLDVDTGQIAWSVLGAENKVLSGRSEQISVAGGVASTYACANCCPNVIDGVQVNPLSLITEVSQVTQFTATQTERNCYDAQFGPYQANPNEWNSFSPSVATVDFTGNSEAVGVGDTNIQGCVERTIWYNWGGGYCEPFTDLMCDEAPVEVDPDVVIDGPNSAVDGTEVDFVVTVSGATATGISWEVEAPSGAGNNPQMTFIPQNELTTTATVHWFALPNQACPPAANNSTYTIKVTVSHSGGETVAQKSFQVTIPDSAGQVVATPGFTGGPTIRQDTNTGMWVVDSIGSFAFIPNNVKTIFLLNTSQFFNKVDSHEDVHMQQWGSTGLYGQYFQPSVFFNRIRNFTDSTQAGLTTQINNEFAQFRTDAIASAGSVCNQAEIDAYTVSDPLTPLFFYQRCGRTTFNC